MNQNSKVTHNHKVGDVWWRVCDWGGCRPILDKVFVLHTTPSGVYLGTFPTWKEFNRKDKGQKLVILSWKKKWAYPTPKEAIEAYWWRKTRQLAILEGQIQHTKECLDIAEKSRGGDSLVYPNEELDLDYILSVSPDVSNKGLDNAQHL